MDEKALQRRLKKITIAVALISAVLLVGGGFVTKSAIGFI